MVSRETSLADGLATLGFGARPDLEVITRKLGAFAELLERRAIPRGYMSESEAPRLLTRHLLESVAIGSFLPADGTLVDIGSGAGLPGVVLACVRPGPVVLVEASARRAAFLREVAHELDLQLSVVQNRAEDAARGVLRDSARGVTARGLAGWGAALELLLPFGAVGATIALPLGRTDAREATRGSDDLPLSAMPGYGDPGVRAVRAGGIVAELGGTDPRLIGFEVPGAEESRWVMIVQKIRSTPERYPRSANAIRRRPLS